MSDINRFAHVLCIYPYNTMEREVFFPPTGLEYVASAFATRVPRVTIADLRHDRAFQPEQRLHEFIRREGVDLLAVSINWHFGFEESLEIINRLPPGIFTVVGGNEATVRGHETMEHCPNIDALARGEAEETVIELASGKPLREIRGLSWRHNGSVVDNENRIDKSVEKLPERNRSLRRMNYHITAQGVKIVNGGFDTVVSSRGCPFNCKFCPLSRNPFGRKRDYDERLVESVFNEIQSLTADTIYFPDDNFFVNRKRTERLCDMLIKAGVKKRFIAQARIDLANSPRLLEKLVRAGFKGLLLGIESANDRSLEIFNKGFTVAQAQEYFKTFRRFPIWYHGYFIIGNIGETEDEMLMIPGFAHQLGLDSVSVMHLKAPKFAPIRKMVEETPGYYIDPGYKVYSDRYPLKDLQRIRNTIKREFYTPAQVFKAIQKNFKANIFKPQEFLALPFRLGLCAYKRKHKRSAVSL